MMRTISVISFFLLHFASAAQIEVSEKDLKDMLQGSRWKLLKYNVSGTTQIRKGLIVSTVEFYRDSIVIFVGKSRLTGKWQENILAFDIAAGKGAGSYLIVQVGLALIYLQDLNRQGPRIPYSLISTKRVT